MKRILFAIFAVATLAFASCQKVEEFQDGATAETSYVFNFNVATPDGDDTKAVKTSWTAGDKINLWFDGATVDPQVILTYDGSAWTGEQKDASLVLGTSGKASALYEGHNDLSKLNGNVPLVISCEQAVYSVEDGVVAATLDTWAYETAIQIVVPGIEENYADYTLSCENLCGGSSLDKNKASTEDFTSFSISGSAYGKAVTGVENADGAAFYFISSNVSAAQQFVFTLTYNEKDYTYTSKETTIYTDNTVKRVNKKLPAFAIDESGNPASGCAWKAEGAETEVEHSIEWSKVTDWETVDGVLSLTTSPYGYYVYAVKNDGTNEPTVNSTDLDCRIYSKGSITIENAHKISKIVFNISTQGLKRLAPITASVGEISEQKSGDDKVVWTGLSNSVTFTVGENADYGTDGSSKAGQLDFSSIDATYVDDGIVADYYSISIASEIVGGTVKVYPTSANAGSVIYLTATPDEGYLFSEWNVVNDSTAEPIEVSNGSFIMPESNVTVSAVFEKDPYKHAVKSSFTAVSGSLDDAIQYSAVKGDGTTNPAINSNRIRLYKPSSGKATGSVLTISAAGGNKIVAISVKSSRPSGLVCKVDDQDAVVAYSGSTSPYLVSVDDLNASKVTFTNTYSDTNDISEISVTYLPGEIIGHSVTFADVENGKITATVDGNQIVSGQAVESGKMVTLSSNPSTGYEFVSWSVMDSENHSVAVNDDTFEMPDLAVIVSAEFSKVYYDITANPSSNGTFSVKVNNASATKASYGDEVTLIATPQSGYELAAWTVTNLSTNKPITVSGGKFSMPASAVSITASFVQQDSSSGSWQLVTDASTLSDGDVIKLGCKAKSAAAGAMGTGSFFTSVDATIENNVLSCPGAIEITLGKSGDAWTLTTSEGTIGASGAKALKRNDGTTTWTIEIANGVATIKNSNTAYGWIQYNASSPRFVNYSSSQTAIEIYKKN